MSIVEVDTADAKKRKKARAAEKEAIRRKRREMRERGEKVVDEETGEVLSGDDDLDDDKCARPAGPRARLGP